MTVWPHFDDEQIADVVAILKSGRINAWTGTAVARFERAYAQHLGRRNAIAVSNGTVALDVALHAIDLKPGDEVVVTPRSFVASASCVPMAGGIPVFADVDPDSQAITAETIAAVLTPRTRAVIVVHLGGWPADMDPILDLARRHGIAVIEDCAQAHGGEYRGRPVGRSGDIAVFSFCQDKIITTGGEGGLIAMDDEALWNRAWSRKDHGKAYDTVFNRDHAPGFRWLHESFGSNYRMMEIQAAIGLRQLDRLATWHARRSENARILIDRLRTVPGLRTPQPPANVRHAWYRFYTFVRPERLKPGWDRDRIMRAVTAAGVTCNVGSCSEIYREKCFADQGLAPAMPLPAAAALGATSLAFLVDPCQSAADMARAATVLADTMEEAIADQVPAERRRAAGPHAGISTLVAGNNDDRGHASHLVGRPSGGPH